MGLRFQLINSSDVRMPRAFIHQWLVELYRALRIKKLQPDRALSLTVVFFNPREAKKINFKYRKKNYATDILSFEGDEHESLGELVLCPQVLKKQSQEHGLQFQQELGYMLIHGVLHLLGFDHEKDKRKAKEMFQIQDEIFEDLSRKMFPKKI